MKPAYLEIKTLLESNYPFSIYVIEYCKYTDLLNSLKKIVFPDFFEHTIHFKPTYKKNKLTGKYKLMKKKYGRLPGFADRVIIKTKYNINTHIYDSLSFCGNDHFPIFWAAQILDISIGIISWNVGKANLSLISPENMRIYFERFGKLPDIFVIGLQECNIKTKPDFVIWEGIYDSLLNLNSKRLKNYIGQILGFGVKTYIMYNSKNLKITTHKSSTIGTVTKSINTCNINIYKKHKTCNLILCNLHAPFTENINKYKHFLSSAYKQVNKLSSKNDIIHIIFGDLNSRCLLNIEEKDIPSVIKNIRLMNNSKIQTEKDLFNISQDIQNYMITNKRNNIITKMNIDID